VLYFRAFGQRLIMTTISAQLQAVIARIDAAARKFGRHPEAITLLAVSKTWPASAVREAAAAGQRAFGENYLQEGLAKAAELAALGLQWHFIGPLQSNKTRRVAEVFDWVHSIDRLKVAQRLAEQRPATLPPLQVCLQVNVSGEASKSGVALTEVRSLAQQVARLPGLKLRGLMAIPAPVDDFAQQRQGFARVRESFEQLNEDGLLLDTLSMGMSHDLEAAIAEGASMVRVGSAIFGERIRT
jgi:pyridoxal phosphate enzyme (YggS family)